MMHFILRLLVNAAVLALVAYTPLGFGLHVDTITALLIGAIVLGLLNAIVRPILIVVSCPLEVLSLGLFTLIINAVIVYFGLKYIPGWHVPGFWQAFGAAIVMSVVSWVVSLVFHEGRGQDQRASQ